MNEYYTNNGYGMDIRMNSFHCPSCGGRNLQAITETTSTATTTGGGYSGGKGCLGFLLFGPFGLLCGNCGNSSYTTVTNKTKTYWTCPNCGRKFRDPDELKKEAEDKHKELRAMMILGIVTSVGFFILWLMRFIFPSWFNTYMTVLGVMGIISFIYLVYRNTKEAEKLDAEYIDLINRCRD